MNAKEARFNLFRELEIILHFFDSEGTKDSRRFMTRDDACHHTIISIFELANGSILPFLNACDPRDKEDVAIVECLTNYKKHSPNIPDARDLTHSFFTAMDLVAAMAVGREFNEAVLPAEERLLRIRDFAVAGYSKWIACFFYLTARQGLTPADPTPDPPDWEDRPLGV
jgi:hypothetical protein